jgi:hypothetical protein
MLNTAAAVAAGLRATASIAVSSSQVVAETAVTLTAGDSPALTSGNGPSSAARNRQLRFAQCGEHHLHRPPRPAPTRSV